MKEKDREKELDELEVNLDILSMEPGEVIDIAKGSDFTLLAEKTPKTGGLAFYLEMEGKREVVDFRDAEELAEIEEELRDIVEAQERGDISAMGVKPRTHRHRRPRCRVYGKPHYCGVHECFGGGAIHIACINMPFTKKHTCICIGQT